MVGDIIVVGPLVLAGIFLTERGIHWFGFAACVYAELRERGHPICGKCGYDLAALPSPAPPCPECGRANPPFQTDPGGPPVAVAPEVARGPTRPLEPPTPTGYP